MFAKWPEENLRAVIRAMQPIMILRGGTVYLQGDPTHCLYVLASGTVHRLIRKPSEKSKSRAYPMCALKEVITGFSCCRWG